jgi:hypothetical protein
MTSDFELDTDPERVDTDALWRFMSEEAYWGRWRSRADVEAQLAASWRVVGAYELTSGRMVGFARAISDGIGLAYLADVYVEPDVRERGPGVGFRWMLHTADAHGLYERFGFAPPAGHYLERPGPRYPSAA